MGDTKNKKIEERIIMREIKRGGYIKQQWSLKWCDTGRIWLQRWTDSDFVILLELER